MEPVPETPADFAKFGQVGECLVAIAFIKIISDASEVKREALEVSVYVVGWQRAAGYSAGLKLA